jgi:exo-1,4-beta-D-glucosaminidase
MEAGVSDETRVSFGIRDVCDYFTPEGHRGFQINGKKILITGAGWTDDLFLGDTPATIDTQLRYVRDMNLNSIRLEGIWGKDHTLYDLCDRYGILIMVGWSCHWEHEQYVGKEVDNRYGGVNAPEEIALIGQSWEDQVIWLRNHPSIYVWAVASDKVPHPELEKRYIETFQTYEPTRPYLCSTGGVGSDQHIIGDVEIVSDVSGTSGIKMLGPYAYTPPVYWYTDTARGGAFGFNSETGPGAQVPVLESIKRMIPEDHLWPPDEVWDYHCALNEFDTLDRFMTAMEKRYGAPATLDEFDLKAQMLNYELMRPMFEAFHANKGKSTGIIHWMLNAAWPKMYWQLYDWFLKPNAAYYAVKKACNRLHLLYNYGDAGIYLVNNTFEEHPNCQAEIRVYDVDSIPLLMESIRLDLKPDSSTNLFTLPSFLFLSSTYFLDLRLRDESGHCLETNFYWLSTKPDVLDYDAKVQPWAFYTPSKAYADFTQLNNLAKATIQVRQGWIEAGAQWKVTVELCNESDCIAFFINATLLDEESGHRLHPVFWDDNYIHLLPKETRTLEVVFDVMVLQPRLAVQGWNTSITML